MGWLRRMVTGKALTVTLTGKPTFTPALEG